LPIRQYCTQHPIVCSEDSRLEIDVSSSLRDPCVAAASP
jgi:hypothetical protein